MWRRCSALFDPSESGTGWQCCQLGATPSDLPGDCCGVWRYRDHHGAESEAITAEPIRMSMSLYIIDDADSGQDSPLSPRRSVLEVDRM